MRETDMNECPLSKSCSNNCEYKYITSTSRYCTYCGTRLGAQTVLCCVPFDCSDSEKYADVGYHKLESLMFQEYDINEVESRDACEYHAMTSEHTEVLGQFLDYSGMDIEQLKKCLIAGYLSCIRGATVFLKQGEYEELIEHRNDRR